MIQLSKKMKWVCGIGAAVLLTALLSMCGGGSKKSSDSDENQSNESRKMEVSTLKLKGPHASLFKVDEPYVLSMVNTPDEGWQVRVKINFVKAKDFDSKRYQPVLHCCRDIAYLDDFDVELQKGQYSYEDFSTLLSKEVGESEEITLKPFCWDKMSYSSAKKIYDGVRNVVIYEMELETAKKEDTRKKSSQSIFDDDDLKDVKDAAETASKLLEAEKEGFRFAGELQQGGMVAWLVGLEHGFGFGIEADETLGGQVLDGVVQVGAGLRDHVDPAGESGQFKGFYFFGRNGLLKHQAIEARGRSATRSREAAP